MYLYMVNVSLYVYHQIVIKGTQYPFSLVWFKMKIFSKYYAVPLTLSVHIKEGEIARKILLKVENIAFKLAEDQ